MKSQKLRNVGNVAKEDDRIIIRESKMKMKLLGAPQEVLVAI